MRDRSEELTPLLRLMESSSPLAGELPPFQGQIAKVRDAASLPAAAFLPGGASQWCVSPPPPPLSQGVADKMLKQGMKLFKKGEKGGAPRAIRSPNPLVSACPLR